MAVHGQEEGHEPMDSTASTAAATAAQSDDVTPRQATNVDHAVDGRDILVRALELLAAGDTPQGVDLLVQVSHAYFPRHV